MSIIDQSIVRNSDFARTSINDLFEGVTGRRYEKACCCCIRQERTSILGIENGKWKMENGNVETRR
jgi:hypothetical protein